MYKCPRIIHVIEIVLIPLKQVMAPLPISVFKMDFPLMLIEKHFSIETMIFSLVSSSVIAKVGYGLTCCQRSTNVPSNMKKAIMENSALEKYKKMF